MCDTPVKMNWTDDGIFDQEGNSYALVDKKDWEHLHTIIQALNEALVGSSTLLLGVAKLYEHHAIHGLGALQTCLRWNEKALALVPEQDRKGGTWRMEE